MKRNVRSVLVLGAVFMLLYLIETRIYSKKKRDFPGFEKRYKDEFMQRQPFRPILDVKYFRPGPRNPRFDLSAPVQMNE